MSKIKLISDSACDIPKELEEKYDIRIIPFPICVGDKSMFDREMDNMDFYELIANSPDLPTHSQINVFQFEEIFKDYAQQGYTDVIYIAIAQRGSATYSNAVLAAENLKDDPLFKDKCNLYIVDSGGYSGATGYPIIQAAIKAEKGATGEELVSYLNEIYACSEMIFGVYTLEFVKKSGRVKAAAAFAGELLGLRPIITLNQGISEVPAKVRGDKNVIPKIVDIVAANIIPQSPYVTLSSMDREQPKELAKLLTERLGYPPEMDFMIGGVISANTGPKMIGVGYRKKPKE